MWNYPTLCTWLCALGSVTVRRCEIRLNSGSASVLEAVAKFFTKKHGARSFPGITFTHSVEWGIEEREGFALTPGRVATIAAHQPPQATPGHPLTHKHYRHGRQRKAPPEDPETDAKTCGCTDYTSRMFRRKARPAKAGKDEGRRHRRCQVPFSGKRVDDFCRRWRFIVIKAQLE